MGIMDTIKSYASAIKMALGLLLVAAIAFAWWYHGHQQYLVGKAEVQALWDADKKVSADTIIASLTANEALKSNLEINKNESQKRIDALAADNKRLRVLLPQFQILSPTGASGGQVTAPGGGVSGLASGRELPSEAESPQRALDEFMAENDEDALGADTVINSCRVVFEWAKAQSPK
ncbi:MAG TPA: hypothetical protein PKZ37_14735 [Gallionellaceae bacterium]|jgi:hypothetical protein|nr:hypothetical protein [Gallionellaceae bacterium]